MRISEAFQISLYLMLPINKKFSSLSLLEFLAIKVVDLYSEHFFWVLLCPVISFYIVIYQVIFFLVAIFFID